MQSIESLEGKMDHLDRVHHEKRAFSEYVAAIGATVGHHAPASKARKACPAEFAAWHEAFIAAYGTDPS